jgi:hypothetical protein
LCSIWEGKNKKEKIRKNNIFLTSNIINKWISSGKANSVSIFGIEVRKVEKVVEEKNGGNF